MGGWCKGGSIGLLMGLGILVCWCLSLGVLICSNAIHELDYDTIYHTIQRTNQTLCNQSPTNHSRTIPDIPIALLFARLQVPSASASTLPYPTQSKETHRIILILSPFQNLHHTIIILGSPKLILQTRFASSVEDALGAVAICLVSYLPPILRVRKG